ncbi:lectin BRA-3-like [Asterias amurensis]|uniref:lectin BRA-3-like n=1 Tax=Asterias amurensis TaxID=7602 RepID=UPI003AB543AD
MSVVLRYLGVFALACLVVALPQVECRCPAGATNWIEKNSTCYNFIRKEETWDQARLQCAFESANADLVMLKTADELIYVHTLVHAGIVIGCGKKYWIGLNDRELEGEFKWVDGTTAGYTNWARFEPNNAFREDCTEMGYEDAQWNDEDCGRKRCFVCAVTSD